MLYANLLNHTSTNGCLIGVRAFILFSHLVFDPQQTLLSESAIVLSYEELCNLSYTDSETPSAMHITHLCSQLVLLFLINKSNIGIPNYITKFVLLLSRCEKGLLMALSDCLFCLKHFVCIFIGRTTIVVHVLCFGVFFKHSVSQV